MLSWRKALVHQAGLVRGIVHHLQYRDDTVRVIAMAGQDLYDRADFHSPSLAARREIRRGCVPWYDDLLDGGDQEIAIDVSPIDLHLNGFVRLIGYVGSCRL